MDSCNILCLAPHRIMSLRPMHIVAGLAVHLFLFYSGSPLHRWTVCLPIYEFT